MDRRAEDYGPRLAALLDVDRLMPLGAGREDPAIREALSELTVENVLGDRTVSDRDMAAAVVSAMWLYHGFLDASHTISQSLESPTGSFLHGIMHRREGDFGNAKYWFRRAGRHPIEDSLVAEAIALAEASDAAIADTVLGFGDRWDPFRFVDLVADSVGTDSQDERLCQQIQREEWWLLFDYAYRSAAA